MYYYIFEPPTAAKEYERIAHIKEALAGLGIAGEMAQPMPGKTVAELVNQAVQKRYSTIVAVGHPDLINSVAHACEPFDVVMGIIPATDHPDLIRLIGTTDWKVAIEQLKRRRWHHIRLGLLNDQLAFLTPARVHIPAGCGYILSTPDFQAKGSDGCIEICPEPMPHQNEEYQPKLEVWVNGNSVKSQKGFFSRFMKKGPDLFQSHFLVDEISIDTTVPVDVEIAGQVVTHTPLTCIPQTKPLRLISSQANGGDRQE